MPNVTEVLVPNVAVTRQAVLQQGTECATF